MIAALARRQWAWPSLATVAVLIVVTVLTATTFRDYGIGWDGRVQDVYGQKLLAYYLSGFHDQSAFTYSDLRFYGGFFDLLAAAVNRLSPLGEFETRHLLGAIVFLAGLGGAWRLTHLLAGPRAAAIAVICLASTPVLYGHAFINPKDSPFAWLLVWVSYFACRILAEGRALWTVYLGFALVLGCALGTKVFAVAYLGYLLSLLVLEAVDASWRGVPEVLRRLAPPLMPLLWAVPLAGLVMAVFWPWSVLSPGNFVQSIATFLRFPHQVPVLWEGETFQSTHPPAGYLPVLLALKLPEYVLAGLVAFGFFALQRLRRGGVDVLTSAKARQFMFVAMSALIPIAAFVILRPTVYNGIRQYLFVVPPLVILAAVGLDRLLALAAEWRAQAAAAVGLLLALGVGREASIMSRVHPYEYVSFNALAGTLAQAGRAFELDYWGTSLAEGIRDLPRLSGVQAAVARATAPGAKVYVCGDRLSAEYFAPPGVRITDKVEDADFLLEPDTAVCGAISTRGAREVFEVKREGAVLTRIFDMRTIATAHNSLKSRRATTREKLPPLL